MNSSRSHYYLFHDHDQLIGFAHLVEPEAESGDVAEIRTIGVLPAHRGAGIGRDLLQYSLNQARVWGHRVCRLSVATENDSALALYLSAGFKIVEKYNCYRYRLR